MPTGPDVETMVILPWGIRGRIALGILVACLGIGIMSQRVRGDCMSLCLMVFHGETLLRILDCVTGGMGSEIQRK